MTVYILFSLHPGCISTPRMSVLVIRPVFPIGNCYTEDYRVALNPLKRKSLLLLTDVSVELLHLEDIMSKIE